MLSHGHFNAIGSRVYVVCVKQRHVIMEGSLRCTVVKHVVWVAASGVHSNVKVSHIVFVLSINQQRPCGTSSSTAACQGERGKNKPSKRVLEVQQPVSPWIVVYSFFPLRQWDDNLLDNI